MTYLNKHQFAKYLRTNQTSAEKLLWSYLRGRNFFNLKFRRQHRIENYIVDFVCLEKKLIIELDGVQHAEQRKYDERRTILLESKGFKVLRYWNEEIFSRLDVILKEIIAEICV